MRRGGFGVAVFVAALFLALSTLAVDVRAAIIGNWDKSGRSWNNSHMTRIKAAMVAAGHQVQPDTPITEDAIRSLGVFVIAEPTTVPSTQELALLRNFLDAGGVIFVFGDTGIELPTYNSLLSGVGSTMSFIPTTIGTSSVLSDNKFTAGPANIVGDRLSVTSGNGTTGGTLVDNNYVRYEQIKHGYMVVFGDRIDHNDVISPANIKLILNLVAVAPGPVFPVPAVSPAGLALASLVLIVAGFGCIRRRRVSGR